MMFKNSFKLLCSNFDKVWKLLVYQILSWGIVVGLLAIFHDTYIPLLTEACNLNNIDSVFMSGTLYGINIPTALTAICNAILKFVELLFTTNVGAGIFLLVVLFFVRPLFAGVGKYVVCEMMYGFMATSSKHGFTSTLLRTLNKSLPYALVRLVFIIPFDALIMTSIFGLTVISHPLYAYAMPFLVVLFPAVCLAFKETFTAGWAPAMIVYDYNVFKAFVKGQRVILRRGARVFSTSFVIYVFALVLSMVFGLYSLIVILPVIYPLYDIFENVAFFSSQGMRFYSDLDTIVTPKKLEEVDKIEDAKYLL